MEFLIKSNTAGNFCEKGASATELVARFQQKNGRRPRVLIVSRIHLPEAAAASFRLHAVEEALVRAGAAVRVFTTSAPRAQTASVASSAEPSAVSPAFTESSCDKAVRISRWPALRDSSGYIKGYLPYMSFDIPLFFRILFTSKVDAVLVEPPPTTGAVSRAALRIRHTPYIWYGADVWSDATKIAGAPDVVVRVVRSLEQFTLRGAIGAIAVTSGVNKRLRALGAQHTGVIPNGIDTNVFIPSDGPNPTERAAAGICGPYVIYAGTASQWQGAEIFARAFSSVAIRFPDAQIIFVGQGSSWETLAKIAAMLPPLPSGGARMIQIPPVDADAAARWQAGACAALVSIVPGKGYDFAYPTKVLSALSCGTPVIYSGTGPVASGVRDNDLGWGVDYRESKVADAMCEAFKKPRSHDDAARLRQWVLENRSARVTGERAASFILGCIV